MPIIHEMDEFVNWDGSIGGAFSPMPGVAAAGNAADEDNIGLVLENINEDDFSFHALQHFTQNSFHIPGIDAAVPATVAPLMDNSASLLYWETPESPCAHCLLGGYSCKKIREGIRKGYCTSCVALRLECSFGGVVPDNVNPESTTMTWQPAGIELISLSNEDLLREPLQPLDSTFLLEQMNPAIKPGDDAGLSMSRTGTPAKIGARFSRESVRILKNWLLTHNRHPYPSDEEKEMLQRQTGLNKTQITNWLANARRRGKVQPPRSTSPHPRSYSGSIDIPQRRGTPSLEAMNPLQRWEHSPPEHEPASVTAIARAVTASSSAISSGLNSPHSHNYTDDGSNRSLCNQSSTSSLGTSHSSGGSMASAYSHGSRNSLGSFGSAHFNTRGRRRRRRAAPSKETTSNLTVPLKTFQCTFCTETFRTKHDWQRHEKSLHLSLERWVCAPDGPRVLNPSNGQMSCIFCGEANPDDAHIETHNHSACQERSLEERTFYRKDHLNQHLRLVHNVKFQDGAMKSWKVSAPEIRSRCGFCGIVMDTWTIRVDHLAEHFKTGYSMADWKGDWGFDRPVLDMVENSIPPYLIHHERISPLPYVASQAPPESPRTAYELIKMELAHFGANHWELHERAPTDEEMMLEGCRIVFASEMLSLQGIATQSSWLRDLIMNSDELAQKARFGPLRGAAESRLHILKINGKDNLFEECPMEVQLHEFVKAKILLGITCMDDELQEEARKIVGRVEEVSTHPSEAVANWLLRLITSSTNWLAPFRRRAHLPRSEDVQNEAVRSRDPYSIDSTIHNYSRLECELADFLKQQRSIGKEPTDADLQRQARIIIYEFDDGWNQTAADSINWITAFRQRNFPEDASPASLSQKTDRSMESPSGTSCQVKPTQLANDSSRKNDNKKENFHNGPNLPAHPGKAAPFFLNDANCYRRLAKELKRWVMTTMSANNPSRHVPTDEELQYQARWILYDDDDPWNQTAADNAEWLLRFKRDAGIIKVGPGLPPGYAWAVEQGGTGFWPPYACPKSHVEPVVKDVETCMRSGSKPFTAGQSAVNSFLETLATSPSIRPAIVFCSRELERGLEEFVNKHFASTGCLPSDDAMKMRGREILNAEVTAAEDPELLEKFKKWVTEKLCKESQTTTDVLEHASDSNNTPAAMSMNMDVNLSDAELGTMLKDMDFEFPFEDFAVGMMEDVELSGGVTLRDGNEFRD